MVKKLVRYALGLFALWVLIDLLTIQVPQNTLHAASAALIQGLTLAASVSCALLAWLRKVMSDD